ncbi:hypothetical protein ACFXGA_29345, partial [Actinosynnema sp. NPDC059335]
MLFGRFPNAAVFGGFPPAAGPVPGGLRMPPLGRVAVVGAFSDPHRPAVGGRRRPAGRVAGAAGPAGPGRGGGGAGG